LNDIIEVIENEGTSILRHDDAQIDLYFKMHQKINAKSEEISKSYKNNILVKLSDVKELHLKALQTIASSRPIKKNINVRIAVSHNEGESEKFNSFEAFEERNFTNPNPTSDLLLVYSFSIHDDDSDSFENYKVICHVWSRVAELSQIEKEAPPFISSALLSSMVTTTAKISVHYSDYVKARSFTAMFDEWVKGCDESKSIEFVNKLKNISHLISKFGRLAIFAALGLFTANAIGGAQIPSDQILKFLVVYASIFVIVGGVSETILRKLELSIDSYLAMSYLNINKGDAKIISEFSDRNKSSVKWSIISLIATIAIGLATSASYDFIKWLIV
jgi:hypothetical protein